MLNHGGQLLAAQRRHPAQKNWLDLSTGIAPWSWPVPTIPTDVWLRLPESDDALCLAAARYYGCDEHQVLPVSGSQVAIEAIPRSVPKAAVAVPLWGYGEHRHCWQKHGHELRFYRSFSELVQLLESSSVRYVVVINPNNPTAEQWTQEQLQTCLNLLPSSGLLLVDEAFADVEIDTSVGVSLLQQQDPRLLLLRSVGKFFGMAGLRLGFVLANQEWIQRLRPQLPLWGVSHPALWLGERMLQDSAWQKQQKQRIVQAREQQWQLLQTLLPQAWCEGVKCEGVKKGALFFSLMGYPMALRDFYDACESDGVLMRFFQPQEQQSLLRMGLANEQQMPQLQKTLQRHSDVLQTHSNN